jgi:hypothetical protein
MSREEFLTANLDSTDQVQMTPQEKITDLGKFCKSHLDLIQKGNNFIRGIAEYRVDKCMEAVNSGSRKTSGSYQ